VADWRENPQRVRELDWHTQLEAIGEEQALRERAMHQHEDQPEVDAEIEIDVDAHEAESEEEERKD